MSDEQTRVTITINIPSVIGYHRNTRSAVEKLNQNMLDGEALRIGDAQIVLLKCRTSAPGPELCFEFEGIARSAPPDGRPPAPPKPKRQREFV